MEEHRQDEWINLNGKRSVVLWGGGATLTGMIVSIFTFWAGFYPTIATEEWVEKKIATMSSSAPITREAELRISATETKLHGFQIQVEKLEAQLNRVESKIDMLLPSRMFGFGAPQPRGAPNKPGP